MNKEQKMWTIITIVTVSVLVLIFAGITYAFFTTSDNEGSTAEIISDSGKMIITYGDGTNTLVVAENISPSNNIIADKTFSVTGTNTTDGLEMPFSVNLEYQNTFENGELGFFLKRVDNNDNVVVNISDPLEKGALTQEIIENLDVPQELLGYYLNPIYDIDIDDVSINTESGSPIITKLGKKIYSQEIANGYFKPNSQNETITFNLRMMFPDYGNNQDYNKGATFNGKIVIKVSNSELIATQVLNNLYISSTKDENGVTLDGLQKDGTGSVNVTLLNNSNKNYKVTLLSDTNLIADTEYDEYDNLRYVGENPNNYISFNNELWRIIGIFNEYNVDTNYTEKMIKIIRDEPLGNYSWDTSDSSINSGQGANEWSQADLMTELNTDYIDTSKTSGTTYWYNDLNNVKSGIYDYSTNIKSGWDKYIATVRWNLGWIEIFSNVLNRYKMERSYFTHANRPDGITRTNTLNQKIGLMYASDYGYASTDENCKNSPHGSTNDVCNCKNNNWMFNNVNQWSLTRYFNGRDSGFPYNSTMIFINDTGCMSGNHTSESYSIRPTLYLTPDVKFVSGNGTSGNPYRISI